MAHPQYTYNPPPQEQAYYDALFTAADKSSAGYLSGPTAVEFLSLSKLPVDLLKTIWSMADQNPTNNTLDKPKFTVAVRLIQLFQNGKKPVDLELNLSPEDAVVPMRPPFFEGVNPAAAAAAPVAPPQQQQQQAPPQHSPQPSPTMQPMSSPMRPANTISMNGGMGGMSTPSTIGTAMSNYNNPTTTLATQDPYTMTPAEQTRYSALFPTYATIEPTHVHGAQAVELFLKSGLDRDQLKVIWTMCDDDPVDNKLDVVEFAIAMHLIVCVTKKGLGLPTVLPGSLVRVRRESRMQQQGQAQQQQQGIPTPPTQTNMGGGASVIGGMSTMQHQQGGGSEGVGGGIPSPEKMPSGMNGHMQQQGGASQMGMQQQQYGGGGGGMTMMPSPEQQQPQMVQPPPQMVQQQQQQQPQMSMQQPQMGMQQPGMMQQQHQQQQPEQQMGMVNGHAGGGFGSGSGFGSSGTLGGETVDDAFAGLPNDPIPDVDAYSAIGGPASTTTVEQMPAIPAPPLIPSTAAAAAPSPALQSMAPPSSSPNMAPVQATQPVPPPPMPSSAAVPMPSPKSPSRNVVITGNANAELEQLKTAHQKLQAEAVSLRAKAGLVSDEEQEAQADIARVASEIAILSTELEGLRTQVMEAKVKLTDAVATLKAQKEKKGSLETAVEQNRETVDALNAATEALVEANETAMAHQAKAVADAAAAKEKAEEAAAAAPSADLFSWDAGAAAPTPAASPTMQGMGAPWGEQPGQPVASEDPMNVPVAPVADAGSVYSMGGPSGVPQQPASVADASSVYSANSFHRDSGFSSANSVQRGTGSFYGDSSVASVQQQPMAPPASQYSAGMGMGAAAAPQPMMQQQQMMMTPTVNTAAQPVQQQQQLPTIESPTAEQLEKIKKDALLAEKSFRASEDLVKTLTREVKHLEVAATKAEEEKKAIESKKKKMGGKKKQKKEIEKAYEFAMGEQQKVQQARQQLDAARRQSDISKNEVDKLRQKYEEAEVEAATAASYLSINASHSMAAGSVGPTGSVAPQQQYQQQYQQPAPAPVDDMFSSDPFGMGGGGMGMGLQQSASSDPYGMGLMGGSADGDYSNPFAM